jgi:lipopolysaccharide cholinephosphotransferase
LNVFHKISNKFKIRYWAEGGTLLGYKRHSGIIPWDDNPDMKVVGEASDGVEALSVAKITI